MKFLGLLSAAASLLVMGADAAVHGLHGSGHGELARRLSGDVDLNRRAVENSKWSYYDTETGNAGSCGRMIGNGEYVVAMNANDYNPSNCFRKIVMTYNGKTATASVGDRCPGCPPGGLDLSTGLFAFFASHDKGIIYGRWEWADEAQAPAPAPAPAPPKTTKQWTPTSTWTPPKPTSTTPAWTPAWTPEPAPVWTPEPEPTPSTTSTKNSSTKTSSSTSSSSTTSSSSAEPSQSAPSSSSAAPAAASAPATPKGNVDTINGLVVQFGELTVGGAYAN